jgi:hypothetical protein
MEFYSMADEEADLAEWLAGRSTGAEFGDGDRTDVSDVIEVMQAAPLDAPVEDVVVEAEVIDLPRGDENVV